jgi:hypothetical protein
MLKGAWAWVKNPETATVLENIHIRKKFVFYEAKTGPA